MLFFSSSKTTKHKQFSQTEPSKINFSDILLRPEARKRVKQNLPLLHTQGKCSQLWTTTSDLVYLPRATQDSPQKRERQTMSDTIPRSVTASPRAAGGVLSLTVSVAALPFTALSLTVAFVVVTVSLAAALTVLALPAAWAVASWALLASLAFPLPLARPWPASAASPTTAAIEE